MDSLKTAAREQGGESDSDKSGTALDTDVSQKWLWVLCALIVTTFALRNVPWHLDDYDQAKQAFTSFEMVEKGEWWFQHTPSGRVATKPPLAGWISAALHWFPGLIGWDLAWRIPPFVCALVLVGWLWRTGVLFGGKVAGLIAVCAFAFNLQAPRLATLVRTDMMLAFFIFVAGWLVLRKVRSETPWTRGERWALAGAILGSLLTKGPILYAFLLPGMVAFAWIMRRDGKPHHAWAGWLPWCAPLLGMAIWVGIGIWLSADFLQQVVYTEFLGRFDVGENPVHKHQPVYFYFTNLVHRWAPWSGALLALCASKSLRASIRRDPALLWLACWAIGGIILMSLIPSKRADRIFPVIPPLCLLLAALAQRWAVEANLPQRKKVIGGMLAFAVVLSLGTTAGTIMLNLRADKGGLARFGVAARKLAQQESGKLLVLKSRDEGLLLYTGQTRFISADDAVDAWTGRQADWLVIPEKDLDEHEAALQPFTRALSVPKIKGKADAYSLIRRSAPPHPGAPQTR